MDVIMVLLYLQNKTKKIQNKIMAIKILSVDDELDLEVLISQYFRRKIRKGEYEFFFAHNGIEALQMLLKEPEINIILSDINMPEMDGLTLLTKINEMHNPARKCIMVSAYGDMGNIRKAMNNGAFDFATKPIDLDDLQLTIDKAVEQIEFVKKSQAEHSELQGIHSDLELSSLIQQAILPRKFPPYPDFEEKVDIFATMKAAKEIGGDFYDVFKVDDRHLGFVIADVSGKGIPAALFMAVSRTVIRTKGIGCLDSEEVIGQANRMLSEDSVNSMFVTVFYGIINVETGVVEYVNAGHNPPYLVRADGTWERLPKADNLVVGVMEETPYHKHHIQLNPGDGLVLYTDGVTEAFDADANEYKEERLEALLPSFKGKNCEEICQAIYEDVKVFTKEAPQSDDITTVVLKRK